MVGMWACHDKKSVIAAIAVSLECWNITVSVVNEFLLFIAGGGDRVQWAHGHYSVGALFP